MVAAYAAESEEGVGQCGGEAGVQVAENRNNKEALVECSSSATNDRSDRMRHEYIIGGSRQR